MRIKKGDNIVVIAGKDKGKTGQVTQVLPHEQKVVVDGVNMRKKHQRPRRQGQKGQVVEFAAPLAVSNIMLADPKTHKPTRTRIKRTKAGPVRVAVKSGAEI